MARPVELDRESPERFWKEVRPQMRGNRRGALINLSSIAAVGSGVGSGYCAATKAALELIFLMIPRKAHRLRLMIIRIRRGKTGKKTL